VIVHSITFGRWLDNGAGALDDVRFDQRAALGSLGSGKKRLRHDWDAEFAGRHHLLSSFVHLPAAATQNACFREEMDDDALHTHRM
jgi:hypothetical protein